MKSNTGPVFNAEGGGGGAELPRHPHRLAAKAAHPV